MSQEIKKVNWKDKFTSKTEIALGLIASSFIVLTTIVGIDYGSVAIGFKDTATTGAELWTLYAANTGLLIGWLLGKKD